MTEKPNYSLLRGKQHDLNSCEDSVLPTEVSELIDALVQIAMVRGGAANPKKQQKRKK